MANIPDISKLKGKFDLKGLMQNVKSIINPNTNLPESAQGNPLAFKVAAVVEAVKGLADAYSKQADLIANLNNLVGELSHEIGSLKVSAAPQVAPKVTVAEEAKAPKEEEKKGE